MAKGLTKSQIADRLAEKTGLTKKQVIHLLGELATLAYEEASNSFTVPGLGKLVVVDRKERKGRNPATGQEIIIPAKRALKFRISKEAKDSVLGEAKAPVAAPPAG